MFSTLFHLFQVFTFQLHNKNGDHKDDTSMVDTKPFVDTTDQGASQTKLDSLEHA